MGAVSRSDARKMLASRLLSVVALALTLVLASGAARAGVVLVVGDSISAGYGVPTNKVWVTQLTAKVTAARLPHTVVNASLSGDTTAGGLSRLPALLRQHKPVVVIIELGGNDGLRGLPMKATRQNLAKMIRLARKSGARVLLTAMDMPPNLGPKYTAEFRNLYPQTAKAEGAVLVPRFISDVAILDGMMQADGIHPNSAAQPKLADKVWASLEPVLRAL